MSVVVVDADVARSASDPSESQRALKAARSLRALLDGGASIGLSPKINEEWQKHRSNFARIWLSGMFARKRFKRIERASQPGLSKRITALDAGPKAIAEKDEHLVNLAMTHGCAIVSFDESARKVFAELAETDQNIAKVTWVSPDDDGCEAWLKAGDGPNPEYYLKR